MFKEQIEVGAKLLDEKLGPVWLERQNLEILDLGHACNCIIGQVYECKSGNDYCISLDTFFPDQDIFLASYDHGFSTPDDDFEELTEEWKDYIEERREQS